MGKKYTYVYAEVLTGIIHLEEEHIAQGHTDEDCYQLKDKELDDVGTINLAEPIAPAPKVRTKNEWQQQLEFAKQSLEDDDVPDSIKEMMHDWLGDRFKDIQNERDSN
tara:strand:+ start:443 stop:766 length:324 start_codon:yes stop_codon:yes gene_type:complete